MSSQNTKSLIAFSMAMFGMGTDNRVGETKKNLPPPKPLIQNGHTKFIIEGETIYALNLMNAEKKYLKELGKRRHNS